MRIDIRTATADDAPEMLAIYRPYVEQTAVSFETEPPSIAAFAARITDAFPWLVAVSDGAVVGYAYAGPHRSRAAYRWCVESSVYVHPSARRQGVARQLYQRLLEALSARGFVNVYAGIALPNDASLALHTSLGFSRIGIYEKIGFKLGRWHDVAWYGLRLGDVPDPEAIQPDGDMNLCSVNR